MRFEVSISEGGHAKWGSQCVISIYVTWLSDRALGTVRTIDRSALLRTSDRVSPGKCARAHAITMCTTHVCVNTHDSAGEHSLIQVFR